MRSLYLAPSGARAALSRARGGNTKATTAISSVQSSLGTKRAFSSLPQLRPSILPTTSSSSTVFRAPGSAGTTLLSRLSPPATAPDLVPRSAISAHPALAGAGAQVRCGPRATVARTSRLVRKRRHGFLSRIRTHNGRKTLQRRREKKRSTLSN
ncbi:hypothetical protein F5X99DRAFT_396521 [Biscogniauxia marginata]|nr:hypothetical protein F5X99DRAFT_396521 [Biscogniauxia marginata]